MKENEVYNFTHDAVPYKETLLSMLKLQVKHSLSEARFNPDVEPEERVVRMVKDTLLNHIRQYINVDVDYKDNSVTGVLLLPYVRDEHVKNLDSTIIDLSQQVERLEQENERTLKRLIEANDTIRSLKMPWYKKLWMKLKGEK